MAQKSEENQVQEMIAAEEKLIHDDPLHDVKEEFLHHVDAAEVEGKESTPPATQSASGVVKSDVAPTFAEEYKKEHEHEHAQ